jgi:hypothetical protein
MRGTMMKKTKLVIAVASATLMMAGMMAAPEVSAHTVKKTVKHAKKSVSRYTRPSSSSQYLAEAANSKVDALEAQLQAMQAELISLRSERGGAATTEKVQELDQWMSSVKSGAVSVAGSKNNMVFFRGGYSHPDSLRGGTLDPTAAGGNSGGALNGTIGSQDNWYFGAGFDFSLSDNLFGFMNGTEVIAELMFDYKELGNKAPNGITTAVGTAEGLPVPGVNIQSATVNQLSLAASPKIKFYKGSAFRPWLIPAGFELSIISPPSDAITVLTPGMQFGVGGDYNIWKSIYVGADARYHYAPGNIDGVNTNGFTAGGYLGIGF